MKQKKFKIKGNTLFVFRPKAASGKTNDVTDPTTSVITGTSM